MSLDVWLTMEGFTVPTGSGIFIREDGTNREISREEWDRRFPGREPVTIVQDEECNTVFDYNITHNLGKMAKEAGIYRHLWRPEELGIKEAGHLIDPLQIGLAMLESDPDRFRAFNPSSGWGDYNGLLDFVRAYLQACIKWPKATIHVLR